MPVVSRFVKFVQDTLGFGEAEEEDVELGDDEGLLLFNAKRDVAAESPPPAPPAPAPPEEPAEAGSAEEEPGPRVVQVRADEIDAPNVTMLRPARTEVQVEAGGERDAEPELAEAEADAEPKSEPEAGPESSAAVEEPLAEEGEPATEDAESEAPAPEVMQVAAGGDPADDLLSVFRETAVGSQYADLTNEIEDIAMEELLAEAREVRSLLPQVAPVAEGDD